MNTSMITMKYTTMDICGKLTAETFLHALVKDGLMFHPDDAASDCLADHPLVRCNASEAPELLRVIQRNMDDCRKHLKDVSLSCLLALGEPMRGGMMRSTWTLQS